MLNKFIIWIYLGIFLSMKRLVLKFYENAKYIEWKMALLFIPIDIQKYSKSKECRGFVYKKHTSAAAHMIQLTFVYILYSLYIVCMFKKHMKAVSVSLLYRFCIVCTLHVQKTYVSSFKPVLG